MQYAERGDWIGSPTTGKFRGVSDEAARQAALDGFPVKPECGSVPLTPLDISGRGIGEYAIG